MKDLFGHIYIISLPGSNERLLATAATLSKRGLEYDVVMAEPVSSDLIKPDPGVLWNANSASLSVTTARIIEDAIANKYDHTTILEDDCDFTNRFDLVVKTSLPKVLECDWDLIHLGAIHLKQPFYAFHEGVTIRDVVRPQAALHCHAYMINKLAYKPYLRELKKLKKPIDRITSENFHPKGKSYAFYQNIAIQRGGESTITGVKRTHNNKPQRMKPIMK